MTQHATCSASAASRWMACPGSIRMSEGIPRSSSRDAAQGTLAHTIASDILMSNKNVNLWLGVKQSVDGHAFTVDQEMIDGVKFYLDICFSDFKGGDVAYAEMDTTAALCKLHPRLGGTADRVRYRPSTRHLRVTDFKYGAGVIVEVEDNKQLLVYALGAMLSLPPGIPVESVTVTIVQPRAEHEDGRVRDWTFKAVEILDFAAELVTAAKATEAENAPLVPGPAQCRWCPAARVCPALEQRHHALVAADFSAAVTYDPQKLSLTLESLPLVEARIKAIREFAYEEAMRGNPPPGFKLVEKRAIRRWKSEADVVEWAQKRAVDPYAPRELKSPAQLEKAVNKSEKNELTQFTEKQSSGLTLVPTSDERPVAKKIEATDFAVIEQKGYATVGGVAEREQLTAINLF